LRGYFHGDIRGFNVVFHKVPIAGKDHKNKKFDLKGFRGDLIDFDFTGKKGMASTKYPEGYQGALPDGFRLGRPGDKIVGHHEWRGVRHVLFHLHKAVRPSGKHPELLGRLYELTHNFASNNAPSVRDIQDLKTFLVKIDNLGWAIAPVDGYEETLQAHGLIEPSGQRVALRMRPDLVTGSREGKEAKKRKRARVSAKAT
jgi:hypothetical protein